MGDLEKVQGLVTGEKLHESEEGKVICVQDFEFAIPKT